MKREIGKEVYCGECPFFKNEDTEGYGHCNISKREGHCGDLWAHPTNPVEGCADANPKTMLPNDT